MKPDPGTELTIQPPEAPIEKYSEQNASMMTQLATAQIQSRYIMAVRNPRNVEQVRTEMLRECERPSFCEPDPTKHGSSMAIYAVPRGNVQNEDGTWSKNIITGCTIRFAEMAARAWRNLSVDVVPIGEDKSQRIFQVTATDFEANITASQVVVVPKTVEKSSNKDGATVLSQRTNSYGRAVYTLEATEEEIAMNAQRLISKARRNLILQCIPGWLIEECVDRIQKTARTRDAQDPDAAKRKLFDAFAAVGVTPAQITEYLGHTNALNPAELEDLRGFFSAIKEGAVTWKDIVAAKTETKPDDQQEEIDKLFTVLVELNAKRWTPAVVRNTKGKYVGRPEKLLEYLKEEFEKLRHTGAAETEARSTV